MAISNSLFRVSLPPQVNKPLKLLCRQLPTSSKKLQSLPLPKSWCVNLCAAGSSIFILLVGLNCCALDKKLGLGSPPDGQRPNMEMAIDYEDTEDMNPQARDKRKKKQNMGVIKYYGSQARCPEWQLNEYETVVPDLLGKPKLSPPGHGFYWSAHNNPLSGERNSVSKRNDTDLDECFRL